VEAHRGACGARSTAAHSLTRAQIYRAPLPLAALSAAALAPPLHLALRLHVLRVGHTGDAHALAERAAAALEAALVHEVAVSASVDTLAGCSSAGASAAWRCGLAAELWDSLSDAEVDALLQAHAPSQPGLYTLLLLPSGARGLPVFGAHRHAWVRGVGDAEVAGVLSAAAVAAARRFGDLPLGGASPAPPPVSADGTLRLEFALCNAAPTGDYRFSWDFCAAEAQLLASLAAALAPLAALRAASSVMLHTPAGAAATPVWDAGRGAFVVATSALPQLVDPAWGLHAPAAQPHLRVLHLVAFVPPQAHCPMALQGGAPGFTSPGWGGVALWNPPGCANATRQLGADHMRALFALFAAQLRVLLGLPAQPMHDQLPASSAFAAWEVDLLARRAAAAHQAAARESLASLGRVVAALPNMVVSDTISRLARSGLAAVDAAARAAAGGQHGEAGARAAEAHAAAEGAFFHPSILSLLYFPSDHKLAVYLPLFLPALLPLALTAMREGRHYRRRRAFAAAFRDQARKNQ